MWTILRMAVHNSCACMVTYKLALFKISCWRVYAINILQFVSHERRHRSCPWQPGEIPTAPTPKWLPFYFLEKTANILQHCHWFPIEMMSEKREQKFPNGDMSLNHDMASASDWSCRKGNLLQPIIIRNTTHIWIVTRQTLSRKFCAHFSFSFCGETWGVALRNISCFLRLPFYKHKCFDRENSWCIAWQVDK